MSKPNILKICGAFCGATDPNQPTSAPTSSQSSGTTTSKPGMP